VLIMIFTKVNGKMTWQMDMEFIPEEMEPSSRAIGKMISKMVKDLRNGSTEQGTRENMSME